MLAAQKKTSRPWPGRGAGPGACLPLCSTQMHLRARKASARPQDYEDDEDNEGDEGDEVNLQYGSSSNTCPYCKQIFSRAHNMKRHAEKCINPTYVPRQLKGQPCTPVVPNWICIVPEDVKFPAGARPKSAEVKFMSLSNFKGTGGALGWGGTLTWTAAEMDAINARRKDGDNINTIIVCAMDMLTGDICVWTHDVDLVMYGKYYGATFPVGRLACEMIDVAKRRGLARLGHAGERTSRWLAHAPRPRGLGMAMTWPHAAAALVVEVDQH